MKRLCLFSIILISFFASRPSHAQQSVNVSEYEVKAAFLYNFAKFVEWPSSAVQDTTLPFLIGILGRDPFGTILDQLIGPKSVKGKKMLIRRFNDAAGLTYCHLLFISNSERLNLPQILEKLRGATTLIVGEMEGFADSQGMVQFVIKDNRVRFMINVDASEEAGLKLSSKLLNLAVGVKKRSGNGERE
jgi:hypothetical protein